ncbi:hypothetical protein JXD38_01755 [candidate division WOR-3 bacterium]|nr:hypothetical protein [candidate division WOR-3 bacterium]
MSQLAVTPGHDGHVRWVPDPAALEDAIKSGEGTEFTVDSLRLNVPIPDYVFSKASLRK